MKKLLLLIIIGCATGCTKEDMTPRCDVIININTKYVKWSGTITSNGVIIKQYSNRTDTLLIDDFLIDIGQTFELNFCAYSNTPKFYITSSYNVSNIQYRITSFPSPKNDSLFIKDEIKP